LAAGVFGGKAGLAAGSPPDMIQVCFSDITEATFSRSSSDRTKSLPGSGANQSKNISGLLSAA